MSGCVVQSTASSCAHWIEQLASEREQLRRHLDGCIEDYQPDTMPQRCPRPSHVQSGGCCCRLGSCQTRRGTRNHLIAALVLVHLNRQFASFLQDLLSCLFLLQISEDFELLCKASELHINFCKLLGSDLFGSKPKVADTKCHEYDRRGFWD